jgi:hypothetical protein
MWFSQMCCRWLVISSGIFRWVIRWGVLKFRRKVMDSASFDTLETTRPRREVNVREDINPHGIHGSKNLQLSSQTTLLLHSNMHKYFFSWLDSPRKPRLPHCWGFEIILRHITLGRTPLNGWSFRRRYLYLTAHNTHNRQTCMSPTGFEPVIPACQRPQTRVLDRAATGIGDTWFGNTNRRY